MQTKLLKTTDYLLLVDEGVEIKESTWYVNNGTLFFSNSIYDDGNNPNNSNPRITNYNNSVIAYYPLSKKAKELDLPWLPNPFKDEDNIKELFNRYENGYYSYEENKRIAFEHFTAGYKAAQSKQLELLKRAIQLASDAENIEEVEEEIIQSLSTQQLPVSFELKYRYYYHSSKKFYSDAGFEECSKEQYETIKEMIPTCPVKVEIKTITNPEGREVLVGNYIY